MFDISEEALALIKVTIDLIAGHSITEGCEIEPRLVSRFSRDYSDVYQRIEEGANFREIISESDCRRDYASLHFGISGCPPEQRRPEWRVNLKDVALEIDPVCYKLLEGRKIVVDEKSLQLRAEPQPAVGFIREILQV